MEQEILVPDIGDYSNVEVIEVAIKPGDHLKKDATMITLETDKATMDLPAPKDLKIVAVLVKPGDKVSKGSLIATATGMELLDATELGRKSKRADLDHVAAPQVDAKIIQAQSNQQIVGSSAFNASKLEERSSLTQGKSLAYASPSVRKFARELGVDLSQVEGTHKHGRISLDDVKAYVYKIMSQHSGSIKAIPLDPVKSTGISNFGQEDLRSQSNIDFAKWGNIYEQPLSRIKKKSGKNLHQNWLNIPHVTHFDSADITDLEQYRKMQQQANPELKLTLVIFLIKAVVAALQRYPNFNSSLSGDQANLIIKQYYNIGIAVDTVGGLVVPVVKAANQRDLRAVATEVALLSQKARDNKLGAEDLQGGCFTISSLGGIGGSGFTPIINAPEVAILGVSRHQLTPRYIDKQLNPRLILPFALSYDHRVIDGAEAAKFCRFIAEQLEDSKLYV